MARLPDPTDSLGPEDRAVVERMAEARAHADGKPQLAQVYVRMFNNPALAARVGELGAHLRFGATLPDEVRELAILRYSARQGYRYEWAHHVRPATLAGVAPELIDALAGESIPAGLDDATAAVLEAVDAVCDGRSIPEPVQDRIVAAHGTAGAVEVVVLCGLYAIMGYTCTAFDIDVEDGYPTPPF